MFEFFLNVLLQKYDDFFVAFDAREYKNVAEMTHLHAKSVGIGFRPQGARAPGMLPTEGLPSNR